MKKHLSKLQFSAAFIAAAVTVWNFCDLTASFGGLPGREVNEVVFWEDCFRDIKFKLWEEGYRSGNLGYVTVRSLKKQPSTERDDIHWAQLRYVTVPFNLVRDLPDATYVLADFRGDTAPETMPGFFKLDDHGTGLVLYKSETAR